MAITAAIAAPGHHTAFPFPCRNAGYAKIAVLGGDHVYAPWHVAGYVGLHRGGMKAMKPFVMDFLSELALAHALS